MVECNHSIEYFKFLMYVTEFKHFIECINFLMKLVEFKHCNGAEISHATLEFLKEHCIESLKYHGFYIYIKFDFLSVFSDRLYVTNCAIVEYLQNLIFCFINVSDRRMPSNILMKHP